MIKLILKQDVDKLGKTGEIVKVKDGYGRNFLLPKGLALEASSANLQKLQQQQHQKDAQIKRQKEEFQALADKLKDASCTIAVNTHDDEKLYASIDAQNISKALQEEGFEVDKKYISLNQPIEALGIYEVTVKLHPEVTTNVKVWVVKK